eukprot:m.38629 g.38629  ORF g.38629 m.38629 type:complete len:845 (+) comp11194_c0_seq3:1577-4111(+)
MASTGRRRRRPQAPFYQPTGQQDAEAIQERVLGDARAAVRSLSTSRPFTPADRSRGLFGISRAAAGGGGDGSDDRSMPSLATTTATTPRDSRPASAFPMGRKQFLSALPESDDIPKAPVSKLPPLPARSDTGSLTLPSTPRRRCQSGVHGDRLDDEARTGEDTDEQIFAPPSAARERKRSLPAPPSTPRSGSGGSGRPGLRRSFSSSDKPASVTARPPPSPSTGAQSGQRTHRRSSSAGKTRVSTAQGIDSALWQQVESLLEHVTSETETVAMQGILQQLYDILSENTVRSGRKKSSILRCLFKLLDHSDALLLLRVARVVLLISRAGQTFANACKLLFKLSRSDKNDALFRENKIAEQLVHIIGHTVWKENTDALVYCCGTLKNISLDESTQEQIAAARGIETLSALLTAVAEDEQAASADNAAHLLVQLTAALRNLAVNSQHKKAFLRARTIQGLCVLLRPFAAHAELQLNISRILSKLTLTSACRDALCESTTVVEELFHLAVRHNKHTALITRLYFVLGNLTASHQDNRVALFNASHQSRDLVEQLEVLYEADCKANSISSGKARPKASPKETEDAIIKLVRVIANVCIGPEFGPLVASNASCTRVLLLLLESKTVQDSPELIVNAVGTLNNMSFYAHEDNAVIARQTEVCELIFPLMLERNTDVVIEAARVFGNFTQQSEVREWLVTKRAGPLLNTLLGHENRELVYTVCGILVNMMSDAAHRPLLQSEGGVANMLEALAQCLGTDWQLAGLACKALWNFGEGASVSPQEWYGAEECDGLIELLHEGLALGEEALEEQSASSRLWDEDFAPVAEALLDRLDPESDDDLQPIEAVDPNPE